MTTGFVPQFTPPYIASLRYRNIRPTAADPEGPIRCPSCGGITNDPPRGYHAIHIIVKNGNVTLTGVVDSDTDLAIAEMRANSVSGVFSVDNDLQVASKAK